MSLANCAIIHSCACLFSCRRDSISDGLRRFVLGKVAGFGLGERVEPIAGCGAEGGFDIGLAVTDGCQKFGGRRNFGASAAMCVGRAQGVHRRMYQHW